MAEAERSAAYGGLEFSAYAYPQCNSLKSPWILYRFIGSPMMKHDNTVAL